MVELLLAWFRIFAYLKSGVLYRVHGRQANYQPRKNRGRFSVHPVCHLQQDFDAQG